MGYTRVRANLAVNTDRFPSGSIWGDWPTELVAGRTGSCIEFYDDFEAFGIPGTQTTQINLGRYKVYNTGAGQIITDAMPHAATADAHVDFGGVISMLCDTAGDQSVIGTHACPFRLDTTLNTRLWFEARVATTSILTNMGQWFVGLCQNSAVTFGAAIPLADANATDSTCAMIGFNRLEDGLAVLNTSYADQAAVWTDIQAAANAAPLTQLVANTWIKLGMKVDMSNGARCVRFFVNGEECTTAMTKTALAALTHVDGKGLGPCMAFFADSAGTADYTYLDWWRVGQVVL